MNKKVITFLAAAAMSVQAIAMPMLANAEASVTYITDSDFTDCSVGGNTGQGIYGLNIIQDGSPWLTKGSASEHYETYYHDDERDVNYCNMYSNSDKTGSGDGAGSMYMYQRDTTTTFSQTYGYCQFDVRLNSGSFQLSIGSFTDPTSSTDYLANTITFGGGTISATDGARSVQVAQIKEGEWYTVKVMVDNVLQSVSISVSDMDGKVIGSLMDASYQQSACDKVRIWCFGYIRGSAYNYDLTNVTIQNSTDTTNPFSL